MDRFVCVRITDMVGVDLALFQFDYDLTWAAFMMNPDGAIFGRYGTRAGDKRRARTHVSLASLRRALERALNLHDAYPKNVAKLRSKLGSKPPHRGTQEIPELTRARRGEASRDCIHCHEVGEAFRNLQYHARKLQEEDLWVHPLPESVGLVIDVDDGLRVTGVRSGSPAARAGFRQGDDLLEMGGQVLVSQADIQWVLHHAKDGQTIPVLLRRSDEERTLNLALEGPWRRTNLSWRESSWTLRPGFWLESLPPERQEELGIDKDRLALRVRWIFNRADHVRSAGLFEGDVVIEVDGVTRAMDESEFLVFVRLAHPPGDDCRLKVRRGAAVHEIRVPLK